MPPLALLAGVLTLAVAVPGVAAATAEGGPARPASARGGALRVAPPGSGGGGVMVSVAPLLVSDVTRDATTVSVAGLATAGSPAGRLELRAGGRSCVAVLRPGVAARCSLPATHGRARAVATSPGQRVSVEG